jgi:hypothetical protein
MRRYVKLFVFLIAYLFIFAAMGSAAERSLESIRQAWRSALKDVQTYGIVFQELDADAKACGMERTALADAISSAIKDTSFTLTREDLQLFNMFVDIESIDASDRCISVVSLRVSAFVDPSYAPLLAAEITPWSKRAIIISAKANHPRAIADELAQQAANFAKLWREQQSQ